MRSISKGRRPSPAMVVAVVALVAALAGTGVAATISVLDKGEKKQVKKIARKQANKRITKRAPNLSVANADSANPIAYAHVSAGGTILAETKGISQANLTHPGTGRYCFSGLSFTPRGGQATVDFLDSTVQFAQFALNPGTINCPAGAQAMVGTVDNGGTADAGFFVTFYD